jgi:uncharacterized protein (DUF2461 family)
MTDLELFRNKAAQYQQHQKAVAKLIETCDQVLADTSIPLQARQRLLAAVESVKAIAA